MSKIIAYCEKHPTQRLDLHVEPKPLKHKTVVQVEPCECCIEDATVKINRLIAIMEEVGTTHEWYLMHDKENIEKINAAIKEARDE